MRKRVTEKIIKRRPVMAPVKSSLPFLTCSALSPPVMIWMVATSMITRETAPAVPARKTKREEVKPEVEVEMQPRPVLICGLVSELPGQPAVGSTARASGVLKNRVEAKARVSKYDRMDLCFLSGKELFILDLSCCL